MFKRCPAYEAALELKSEGARTILDGPGGGSPASVYLAMSNFFLPFARK